MSKQFIRGEFSREECNALVGLGGLLLVETQWYNEPDADHATIKALLALEEGSAGSLMGTLAGYLVAVAERNSRLTEPVQYGRDYWVQVAAMGFWAYLECRKLSGGIPALRAQIFDGLFQGRVGDELVERRATELVAFAQDKTAKEALLRTAAMSRTDQLFSLANLTGEITYNSLFENLPISPVPGYTCLPDIGQAFFRAMGWKKILSENPMF